MYVLAFLVMATDPTIETIRAELQSEFTRELAVHRAAIESEFKEQATADLTHDSARALLVPALPDAARTIIALCRHADSETVKLNAAKFIYTEVCHLAIAEDDPIRKLFAEIAADA